MNDSLLSIPDQKEALSRAYAHAVAARAGYITAVYAEDRDGVDLRIQAGGDQRPALDLQLKATVNLVKSRNGNFLFPLKRRNYDLLRIATQTPRLLVVLDLPQDKREWMTITKDDLVLRHRAYWLSLREYEKKDNLSTVTVQIPEKNLFDVNNLRELMNQSRGGKIQ